MGEYLFGFSKELEVSKLNSEFRGEHRRKTCGRVAWNPPVAAKLAVPDTGGFWKERTRGVTGRIPKAGDHVVCLS